MRKYDGVAAHLEESGRGKKAQGMQQVMRVSREASHLRDEAIGRTADVLRSGGLALIPTETVYGLGVAVSPLVGFTSPASSHNGDEPHVNGAMVPPLSSGYRRIFSVKHRDLAQTVPWLVGGVSDLDVYGMEIDPVTRALARRFWPGALTLIVRARSVVPAYMQAADGTVALRCSASPVVAELIRACGCPLAATSANTHGAPAPTSFQEVEPAVLEGVDIALDAGETPCRDASTIVSCVSGDLVVIRRGALSPETLQNAAAAVAGGAARAQEE